MDGETLDPKEPTPADLEACVKELVSRHAVRRIGNPEVLAEGEVLLREDPNELIPVTSIYFSTVIDAGKKYPYIALRSGGESLRFIEPGMETREGIEMCRLIEKVIEDRGISQGESGEATEG